MSFVNFIATVHQHRLDRAEAKSIIADAKKYKNPQAIIFNALSDSSIHPDVRKHLIKHSETAKEIVAEVKRLRDESTKFSKEFKKLEHRKPIEASGKRQSASIRLQELASIEKHNQWINFDHKLSTSIAKVLEKGTGFEQKRIDLYSVGVLDAND